MEMVTTNRGGGNLLVTIRIPYNNGIWRVWVNEETHDKIGNKVTLEFKNIVISYLINGGSYNR